jgi:hypothetical protein
MTMLIGAHSIIYSKSPEEDRAFLRDVLDLPNVDVGDGWLIFGLPPSEVAVHPSDENDVHEFYLMCDDIAAFVATMKQHNIACGPVQSLGWGVLTQLTLPGGGKLGVYQPRHARPPAARFGRAAKRPARSARKKASRSNGKAQGTARRKRAKAARGKRSMTVGGKAPKKSRRTKPQPTSND